jgi:putative SOS response-associated peptidase YedK
MCGRAYQTYTQEELALRYLNEKPLELPEFKANYNLCPTQFSPIIRQDKENGRQLELFRWGLIPHWSKDTQSAYKMINARSETVFEKPSFRDAIRQRRCIVPFSGFYEWLREGESKRPFAIFLKGSPEKQRPIMSVAGIWETWRSEKKEEELLHSFSILTTESNSFMRKIHDRMPVILNQESEVAWLDSALQKPEELKNFFKPSPSSWLEAYEVSTGVNSPKNNSKAVLKPLNS